MRWAFRGWRWPATASPARGDALHELLHGRNKAVAVPWILAEAERVVAGEHEFGLHISIVRDVLQCLLDAEAARIGLAAGVAFFVLRPIGELACRQTAHAR